MAADARNTVTLIGGLVDVPELVGANKNVARIRLAVDYAGNDATNRENRTGYFVVKMFNDDAPNAKFVFGQIDQGNMKKGSRIAVTGRLEHNRYEVDGNKRSEIQIIAEAISYVGGPPATTETAQPVENTTGAPNW